MERLKIETKEKKQVVDITGDVNGALGKRGEGEGLCHIFVLHTTAAVTTADFDPGTDLDMLDAFEAMVPKLRYRHPHNPAHVGDHIMAALIGPGVLVPFSGGALMLGTWQRVVLVELDGPRARNIVVSAV